MFQECAGLFPSPSDVECDHGPVSALLLGRQAVLRMTLQTGVHRLCHCLVTLQKESNGEGIFRRRLHPHVQSLESTMGEVAIERGGYGSDPVLDEAQLGVQILGRRANDSHDDVGVSPDVLGHRMHDEIGAVLEWILKVRRAEGVVDGEEGAAFMGEVGGGADGRYLEGGIRRRLEPQELRLARYLGLLAARMAVFTSGGLFFDGLASRVQPPAHRPLVVEIDEIHLDAHAGIHDPTKVPLRPPVHVVDAQYPLSGTHQMHDRARGGAPARKGDGVFGPLGRGDGPLEFSPGRIAGARIFVPGTERIRVRAGGRRARTGLREGRGEGYGRHHRSRGVVAGVVAVRGGGGGSFRSGGV
mmetsp:Transcript_11367/g.33473  ORF Transcript_11367/g.33473 Transcript_11367/m.33473 type:complete len:357 (-) Transcript_11367:468-1538(-)